MSPVNPLRDDLARRRTSLGLYAGSPEMIEVSAHVGFRWVMIDQMFTGNDWGRTEELIRTANAAGITPVVRVQSFPWLGHDRRIAVDVVRASAIGAEFVMVSNSDVAEIDECLEATKDWHRRALTIHRGFDSDPAAMERERTVVIPHPETRGGIDGLDEVIQNPKIELVFIGMTDASRLETGKHRPDFDNPRLWERVKRAVTLADTHGVTVGASTSYGGSLDELARRIEKLDTNGVKFILVQGATYIFQLAATQLMTRLKPIVERQ